MGVERWRGFCQQSIQAGFKPKSWAFRAFALWGKFVVSIELLIGWREEKKPLRGNYPTKCLLQWSPDGGGSWVRTDFVSGPSLTTFCQICRSLVPSIRSNTIPCSKQDRMFYLSKTLPSSPLLNQQTPQGSSARPSVVVWSLNQHSGSPFPAVSCPAPDLHNNVPERLSSLKCEPMLWPLHSYLKLISYYPVFTLLWSATDTSLKYCSSKSVPGYKKSFTGLCIQAVVTLQMPLPDKVFPWDQPSLVSHELWTEGILLCVYVPMHAQFLRSQSALSRGSLYTWALGEQWQELPGLCSAGALQPSN